MITTSEDLVSETRNDFISNTDVIPEINNIFDHSFVSIPRTCTRCILDTNDDLLISFNAEGVCNHCINYEKTAIENQKSNEVKLKELDTLISKIKKRGLGMEYDCILGLSGGVDSTFLAYQAKLLGLRPLVVHFDNGWNSELAVKNIENVLRKLKFDLYTYVVDWEEFKDLQLSYIKASVLDWEIPTDHGFYSLLYHIASKKKISYILIGHNDNTEAILPLTMRWSKRDVANIKDIHFRFGSKKLKTFPMSGFLKLLYYDWIKKIKMIPLLNYMHYNKEQAKTILKEKLDWKDYGSKHYESVFTRFYQGYVLPKKFRVDKRKAHLSSLICSNQITREEAFNEIKKPHYETFLLHQDMAFITKKLGLSTTDFFKYLYQPNRSHLEFKSYEKGLYRYHEKFFKTIKPLTRLLKKYIVAENRL